MVQEGLEKTKVLRTLKINMCDLDGPALKSLAKAMKLNESVECLDFSFNDISDVYGDILAKMISYQT